MSPFRFRATAMAATLLGLIAVSPTSAAAVRETNIPVPQGETRAHVIFDDTTGAPRPGVATGAPARPLLHAKVSVGAPASRAAAQGVPGTLAQPEILGFAQSGEVTSGGWRSDLQLNVLTTVAYFGLNLNAYGSVFSDAGWQGWWSAQTTDLINSAHATGDRVVMTVKVNGNSTTIENLVGFEQNRQAAVNNIIGQLQSRGGDGVNVDFEGYAPTVHSGDYTTFVSELRAGLRSRVPNANYLTVDTYGSSAEGGSMMDISGLSPYVDAFDVMAYDTTSPCSAHAGPNAPLANYPYNDSQEVAEYLRLVPSWQVILGIPYYGYKWSVSAPGPQAATSGCAGADTYAGILSDFGCAGSLSIHWDANFSSPWATWWSPPSGDPCGGNRNSWRELYYDNAQSLGMKYDLVNNAGLRGIGIWALGYDSGSSDLWSELAGKFACTGQATATPPPGTTNARAVVRSRGGTACSLAGADTSSPVFGTTWSEGGGMIMGAPTVVSVPNASGPGTPFYIATGADYNLWIRSETSWWQPLSPSPVTCTSGPAATTVQDHTTGHVVLVVACRGGDGALWYAQQQSPSASPSSLPGVSGWASLGGRFTDSPAVAVVAPFTSPLASTLTFFVNGTNGRVWTRTPASGWSSGGWSCYGHLAAAAVTSAITSFACQGPDHALWVATNAGGGWVTFSLGGKLVEGPGMVLSPASWTLLVPGTDHAIWQRTGATGATDFSSFGSWSSSLNQVTSGPAGAALLTAGATP